MNGGFSLESGCDFRDGLFGDCRVCSLTTRELITVSPYHAVVETLVTWKHVKYRFKRYH